MQEKGIKGGKEGLREEKDGGRDAVTTSVKKKVKCILIYV